MRKKISILDVLIYRFKMTFLPDIYFEIKYRNDMLGDCDMSPSLWSNALLTNIGEHNEL